MDANLATNVGLLVVTAAATTAAVRSNSHAKRSAGEAARSTKAAEDALALARSERDRAVERGDVFFERSPKHVNGVYTFTNAGTSDAHAVAVLGLINDEQVSFTIDIVRSGESFELDGSRHYTSAKADAAERSARGSGPGMFFAASPRFNVRVRISWQSELGTPGIQAFGLGDG